MQKRWLWLNKRSEFNSQTFPAEILQWSKAWSPEKINLHGYQATHGRIQEAPFSPILAYQTSPPNTDVCSLPATFISRLHSTERFLSPFSSTSLWQHCSNHEGREPPPRWACERITRRALVCLVWPKLECIQAMTFTKVLPFSFFWYVWEHHNCFI